MSTFREIADYILSLPQEQQNKEACFCNIDDDEMSFMRYSQIRLINVTLKDALEEQEDVKLKAIANSNYTIDESYIKYL